MIASSASVPLTICIGALIAFCSVRVLRMAPSFGSLPVAAVLVVTGLAIFNIWPHARSAFGHLVPASDLGWAFVQITVPIWLFASSFSIRGFQKAHLRPFVATFSVCGTAFSALLIMTVTRTMSRWLGAEASWVSCLALGVITSIPDPRSSRDFAHYVSRDQALADDVGLASCLLACVAFTSLTVLQTASSTHASLARLLFSEALSVCSALVLGALGAICAFLMIRQAPKLVVTLTIALALGLVVLANTIPADPAITATVAGVLLRYLMQRSGIVEDETLPGAVFWDLLDAIWSCITVVILVFAAFSLHFSFISVVTGGAAWLMFFLIRNILAFALSSATERHILMFKEALIPGVLLLMTASSLANPNQRAFVLPAAYFFVLLSIAFRPWASAQLYRVWRASEPFKKAENS